MSRHSWVAVALYSLLLMSGCVPRVRPLEGTVEPARVPSLVLPAEPRHVVFRWEYTDTELGARGEGVARIAPPDSVRIDLFLAGGFGSGSAYLLGDSVHAPGGDVVRRMLPPPPLLWAAFGRLAIPPVADTVARVDGDTLRADIGVGDVYRLTVADGRLVRLDRIERGRLMEYVRHESDTRVVYHHEGARRTLRLEITRDNAAPPFDRDIWPR